MIVLQGKCMKKEQKKLLFQLSVASMVSINVDILTGSF